MRREGDRGGKEREREGGGVAKGKEKAREAETKIEKIVCGGLKKNKKSLNNFGN